MDQGCKTVHVVDRETDHQPDQVRQQRCPKGPSLSASDSKPGQGSHHHAVADDERGDVDLQVADIAVQGGTVALDALGVATHELPVQPCLNKRCEIENQEDDSVDEHSCSSEGHQPGAHLEAIFRAAQILEGE